MVTGTLPPLDVCMCVYIYIYIYIYMCVCESVFSNSTLSIEYYSFILDQILAAIFHSQVTKGDNSFCH